MTFIAKYFVLLCQNSIFFAIQANFTRILSFLLLNMILFKNVKFCLCIFLYQIAIMESYEMLIGSIAKERRRESYEQKWECLTDLLQILIWEEADQRRSHEGMFHLLLDVCQVSIRYPWFPWEEPELLSGNLW